MGKNTHENVQDCSGEKVEITLEKVQDFLNQENITKTDILGLRSKILNDPGGDPETHSKIITLLEEADEKADEKIVKNIGFLGTEKPMSRDNISINIH